MQPDNYISFLVRLWREAAGEAGGWRAEVEHVQSGTRWSFPSPNALLDFLQQTVVPPQAPAQVAEPPSQTTAPDAVSQK